MYKTYKENCNLPKNCRVWKSDTGGTSDCPIIILGLLRRDFPDNKKKNP